MNANGPAPQAGTRLGILALLWLVGLYLRLPILIAPPLAPAIAAELGLNQSGLGALTTVPVLMLALGALPGALLIARLGGAAAVTLSLVVLAVASAGRSLAPPVAVLFVCTTLMGLAIAVMQPALPVLVKRWCPDFMAQASAVYMNGLLMGEFVGAGLTLPVVMPLLGGDWRAALVFWSLPALAVAAAVGLRARVAAVATVEAVLPDTRASSRPRALVWKLGIVLGAASAGFFGTNAYLGSLLAARGHPEQLAGVLFYFNATQVVGSLLMIVLARWLVGRRWPVVLVSCVLPLAVLGSALTEGAAFLAFTVVLGSCTCIQLILMVSLVPHIASERDAGPLAAGMFTVGYLLGFVTPLAGGALADVTAEARLALLPMGALALAGAAVALTPGFGHGSPPADNEPGGR